MACTTLACIGDGGCVEPVTAGSTGQVMTQTASGPAWAAAVLDDQTAAEVIFAPVGPIAATNVQAAIAEIITDICTIIGACSVNALIDVDTVTIAPAVGMVLSWDGANWVPTAAAVPFTCALLNTCSIDALADVDTTTVAPVVGDALVWNGASWVPDTFCPVNVTFVQDLVSTNPLRATWDPATCTLNLPPNIAIRALSVTPVNTVAGTQTPVAGFATDFDTVGGTVAGNGITVPKTGRYRITVSGATGQPGAPGTYLGVSALINGVDNGRMHIPLSDPAFPHLTAPVLVIDNQPLTAGDVVGLAVYSSPNGVPVAGCYVSLEWIEEG